MNYYNEFDPFAAAWLRELISEKLIPRGLVDDRSITEVKAEDLEGFTQCHFFAGIGGWPLALQLAGVNHRTPLWTGSPPCQPFSVAGKQLGQLDERHLAPTFMRLVDQCRPAILFGEQVAAAIGKHWLDDLFTDLERQGYTCGAAVLPAASVGAPHKRDRLFFGAHQLANSHCDVHSRTVGRSHSEEERIQGINRPGIIGPWESGRTGVTLSDGLAHASGITDNKRREHAQHRRQDETEQTWMGCCDGGMAHTNDTRPQGREGMPERANKQPAGATGVAGELADAMRQQFDGRGSSGQGWRAQSANSGIADAANTHHGFWSDADWLGCRDGKFRPVEPSTFPLANGIPARVGRLRGYGNAIVPQVAAEFITAFMGAVEDTAKG